MPIYEYQCGECGHCLEAFQRMSDVPLTDCPACGKAALSKQVSAPSFRLKGGGWYETDFKAGKRRHGTQDHGSSDKPNPSPESKSGSDGQSSAEPARPAGD